jgi:DNA-binding transcriptional ArsR family regulator
MNENDQPNDTPPTEEEESAPNDVDEEELMRKLREEQRELRERMRMLDKDLRKIRRRSKRSARARSTSFAEDEDDDYSGWEIRFDRSAENLGETLEAYIGNIMDSVAGGIESAIDGIFTFGDRAEARTRRTMDRKRRKDEHIRRKFRRPRYHLTEEDQEKFPSEGASILSILSDERRLRILQHLEAGPAYQKELSENTGVVGGQWKHHADQLKEAGFIDQEAVRGRYLITQLGREALKLAEMLYLRKKIIEEGFRPVKGLDSEGDEEAEFQTESDSTESIDE